jgi:hypothetical protein
MLVLQFEEREKREREQKDLGGVDGGAFGVLQLNKKLLQQLHNIRTPFRSALQKFYKSVGNKASIAFVA